MLLTVSSSTMGLSEELGSSFSNITSSASDMLNQAYEDVGTVSSFAIAICGFAALIYISSKVWKSWVKGESMDIYGMLRPFCIGLIIINFSYVPQIIETFVSPLSALTYDLKDLNKEEIISTQAEVEKKRTRVLEEGEQQGIVSYMLSIAKAFTSDTIFSLNEIITVALYSILQVLAGIVKMIFIIFALLTKVVLIILGPFVFALSVFPGFGDIVKTWLCRYINVCLYVPIMNIISYVNGSVIINVYYKPWLKAADTALSGGAADTATALMNCTNNFFYVGILCLAASILMFCMTPKIADWLIDGHGSGLIGDSVSHIAIAAGTSVAAYAGAATAASSSDK